MRYLLAFIMTFFLILPVKAQQQTDQDQVFDQMQKWFENQDEFFDRFFNDDFFKNTNDVLKDMQQLQKQMMQQIENAKQQQQFGSSYQQWFSNKFGFGPEEIHQES